MSNIKVRELKPGDDCHNLSDVQNKMRNLIDRIPGKLRLSECIFNPEDWRYDDFLNYQRDYWGFVINLERVKNDDIEIIKEIKKLFKTFHEEKIDFDDAKDDNQLAAFLEDDVSSTDESLQDVLDSLIKKNYENYLPGIRVTTFYSHLAYLLIRIMIARKELTEEQYLMLAPLLYNSKYLSDIEQIVPFVKFKSFENDYEWSKGNAHSIALKLSIENTLTNKGIEQAFDFGLGDDGESSSPESVNA